METHAIFHVAPHTVEVRETETLKPRPGELLVKAHCSAINPGTESLIFRGGMPDNWSMAALGGESRYPFQYGCALVGEVVGAGSREDSPWLGRRVFVAHPHQANALVETADCHPLPEGMPSERALFLANMETALNLAMDAAPLAGERGMIFGQGVVGLLAAAVLSRYPLEELITADPVVQRREWSLKLGAALAIDAARGRELAVLEDCLFHGDNNGLDFAIEVSGQIEALNQAIRLCGFDSRIVVGSWYGRNAGLVDLGGHFHRRRVRLISSQVKTLNPALSGRWSRERRLALALEWLDRAEPERFITHRFPPQDCQTAFELEADKSSGALQVIFEY
jgi:threonine dehydrogenase-like Zn-dependent dehydrogenase